MATAKIYKNVLESLTTSMYKDSKCVLREYIQNAADQIDYAKAEHHDWECVIEVKINSENRIIEVNDDATGVPANRIQEVLIDVAHSEKIRGVQKGFRGIGRLAGLGYCRTLKFETTYYGENTVTTLVWDAARLRSILDDVNDDREAVDVIDEVVTINQNTDEKAVNLHYFKVIMEHVTDDSLLNESEVRNYLSMVAPVDYDYSKFMFANDIQKYMQENGFHLDTYNIWVGDNQLFKAYTNTIYVAKNHGGEDIRDQVNSIDFWNEKDDEGNTIYWGWYSISNMVGEIPVTNVARNIRLRCENIQLGDENTCKEFFDKSEKRFVDWFFGEIHVISKDLIPNAQRDYLREGGARKDFEYRIREDFQNTLKPLCNDASAIRNGLKKIAKDNADEEKILAQQKKGYATDLEAAQKEKELQALREKREKMLRQMERKKAQLESTGSPLVGMFSNYAQNALATGKDPILLSNGQQGNTTIVRNTTAQPKFTLRTDKPAYRKFTDNEKKIINKVYSVISVAVQDDNKRTTLLDMIEAAITK